MIGVPATATAISIHALREEGDAAASPGAARTTENFYPRPPRGGRQQNKHAALTIAQFLSTPSARRATLRCSPAQCRRF